MIASILRSNRKRVFQNESGANLLNGIASALIQKSNLRGRLPYDYAIFEVDENSLPHVLKEVTPTQIVLLNLFRDQLDRYGEVNSIILKWSQAFKQLDNRTMLILNADDPQIAHLGSSSWSGNDHDRISSRKDSITPFQNDRKVFFFGLDDPKIGKKELSHAVDSTYCPNCNSKLTYKAIYYSHLGDWSCPKCGEKRPKLSLSKWSAYPLPGVYNQYNTLAAVLSAKTIGIGTTQILHILENFKPAFGRQEIIAIENKRVQIFLSKNPTSFNESLRTIAELKAKHLLIVLNDRIPDGRDVSWIWDVDFEEFINQFKNITISGDRTYDMALRIKYALPCHPELPPRIDLRVETGDSGSPLVDSGSLSGMTTRIEPKLETAIKIALEKTPKSQTLYILPTYSAMLEVRKILTGKKIL